MPNPPSRLQKNLQIAETTLAQEFIALLHHRRSTGHADPNVAYYQRPSSCGVA
jgi:hypothetical protein